MTSTFVVILIISGVSATSAGFATVTENKTQKVTLVVTAVFAALLAITGAIFAFS